MRFVLTSLVLFMATNTYSNCLFGGIDIYYSCDKVYDSPIFLIERTDFTTFDEIDNWVIKYPIYLISNDDTVGFDVIEKFKVNYTMAQALIRPIRKLKVGSIYELIVGHKFKNDTNNIKFEVINGEDHEGPELVDSFKLINKHFYELSSGSDEAYNFNDPSSDSSAIFVKTFLKNSTKNKVDSAYLTLTENLDYISLGHSACYGQFFFERGCQYEVVFTFIDMYGNIGQSVKYKFKYDLN